ncbi:hypothetical protein [Nocardia wallacei]|uniref:Transcriptional regulator, AbiEi antitoxin, Type IV TA system n=1 Tax=Nocardia wallacei TaxID=480035 RepID=A0A7G1KK41_9NOCA|nr:hypothetical protein [Nocardia wallacei]BCK54339.1 hypothetical protein NWFMUON74_21110 [Nocardia wallacei]
MNTPGHAPPPADRPAPPARANRADPGRTAPPGRPTRSTAAEQPTPPGLSQNRVEAGYGPLPHWSEAAPPGAWADHAEVGKPKGHTGIHRRREVVRRGVSDDEIRRRCSGGRWRRLRRGAYADEAAFAGLDAMARHRVLADAVLPDLATDAIVSHQSAAVIYGAPVWVALLGRIEVTRNRRNGGRIRPDMKVHCAPVDTVAELDGFVLTTPARTIVDVARTAPFEAAVVVGDALAREYGVTHGDLNAELELAHRRHGVAAARRVVDFLDPHSESVGESRSRVMLRRLGLPRPWSQGDVYGGAGRVLGRVDFYFGGTGVVAEFDGRVTYGRAWQPGTDLGEAVRAERDREDALCGSGLQVVRWTWDELTTGAVAPRLRAAFDRARRVRPEGFICQAALPEPKPLAVRAL